MTAITPPNNAAITAALARMADDIHADLSKEAADAVVVGIQTGGVWIADALNAELAMDLPIGSLSVAFHRDDYSRRGLVNNAQPSSLPDVNDRPVILVDEVLHTGRTIRAALNELFDFGRPSRVLLAVLVDRKGRQLPVQPDVTGFELSLPDNQRLKLAGPELLSFSLEVTGNE